MHNSHVWWGEWTHLMRHWVIQSRLEVPSTSDLIMGRLDILLIDDVGLVTGIKELVFFFKVRGIHIINLRYLSLAVTVEEGVFLILHCHLSVYLNT